MRFGRLGLGFGGDDGGPPNLAPTDMAWAGSHVIAENAELGALIGGVLSFTDPDVGATGTFSVVSGFDADGKVGVSGTQPIVTGVFDFETATSHDITFRVTDNGGATFDKIFTLTVSDVAETPPEDPLPDGDVEDDGTFTNPPIETVVDGAVKVHGKGGGSLGKFLYDLGDPTHGSIYTMEYDPDFSLLANTGKDTMVGFVGKAGNDFFIIGLKGDGATGLRAYVISGDGLWNSGVGLTSTDEGAAAHGTQAGPNWLQVQFAQDGESITIRTSSDGNSWVDEIVNYDLSPFTSVVGINQFGPGALFPPTDTGPFSIAISAWIETPLQIFGALAKKAADQTAADFSGGVLLSWDGADVFDTHGFHSPSSNNTKLIVPSALNGYYGVVSAMVEITDIAANTETMLRIRRNGTATYNGTGSMHGQTGLGVDNVATKAWLQCSTQVIQLSTGDEFEAFFDTSVGDTSINIEADNSSFGITIVAEPSVMRGALLRKASDLTAFNFSTYIPITFDTEIYDTNGFHSTALNTSRITIPIEANGKYGILRGSVSLSLVLASATFFSMFLKNGGSLPFLGSGGASQHVLTAGSAYITIESQPFLLTTGDYYELAAYCSDTSVTVVAAETSFGLEVLTGLFAGALVNKSVVQSAANYSTPTVITWDAETYDTAAVHSPGDNTKLVVPAAWNGKYGVVNAATDVSGFASSSSSLAVELGGVTVYTEFGGSGGHGGASTNNLRSAKTQPILLATGQEFTAKYWTPDTSINVLANSSFGIRVIGPPPVADVTPPVILPTAFGIAEHSTLAQLLTADKGVSWSIVGGDDQAKFELVAPQTIRWASDGIKDFETPDDADADNAYLVTVRATDLFGNTADQTITITVVDAPEGAIVYKAVDLTLDPSLTVVVAWTAEMVDTHAAHDPSSNNTKIVIPAAFNGKYGVFHSNLGIVGTPAGVGVSMWITKGGSTSWIGLGGQGKNAGNVSNIAATWCCSQPVLLATGEEYEVVFNSTDTSLTIRAAQSHFSLEIVG